MLFVVIGNDEDILVDLGSSMSLERLVWGLGWSKDSGYVCSCCGTPLSIPHPHICVVRCWCHHATTPTNIVRVLWLGLECRGSVEESFTCFLVTRLISMTFFSIPFHIPFCTSLAIYLWTEWYTVFMYFYRYQYYLQLKADVIDGKLNCTLEQAILLAGYALQGTYNPLVHTARYVQYIGTWKVSTIY